VGGATFEFDTTVDGRLFKILNLVDEYTREALTCHVARRIDADATVDILETIAAGRGSPEFIRCDNGPELTAHAIGDCCRASGAGTVYIDPGAPWHNPWVESFNARLRDELLAIEQFDSLLEAKALVEDWRIDYNLNRPHPSLGYLAPVTYAAT
jgi:putative transposase